MWPAAARAADLELQLAVQTIVYHWLQAFRDLPWRGKPDRQIGATHWQEWLQAEVQRGAFQGLGPARATQALDASALGRALAPHTVLLANLPFDPAPEGAIRKSVPLLPARGATEPTNAPYVRTSTTQAGRYWNTWCGTRCTLPPQRKRRRRAPTSSRGGHGDPRGTPRTPRALHPPQQPAERRSRGRKRRHPTRYREPAMQPIPWERAFHTPWPRHTPRTWLTQQTSRQCRHGTADSRRTRRATPSCSSPGTCATASSHQTFTKCLTAWSFTKGLTAWLVSPRDDFAPRKPWRSQQCAKRGIWRQITNSNQSNEHVSG